MKYDLDDMVQKNHNFCIVDEVDSILIDESRTPLVISENLKIKLRFTRHQMNLLKIYKNEIMN